MAKLVIALHSHPSDSPDHDTRSLLAFHFAQAAVACGHSISMVFCYQQAVKLADPRQLHAHAERWPQWAAAQAIPLLVCSTVAENDYGLSAEQLRPGYAAGGLTEFAQAVAEADQLVQF
ncbi:DsrE/DsrF/TusD sulfur relay family protein [Pseudidiomarina mangrovi]|uniref:DsrE/DsrF/TusD sulfur relay family protein n=1 Tax=Pseudidiomarina mangrovi TaxID=2487133 RepID=UPI000FCB4421|nr:DsrE family protein [Pseudidiomarina mangrovi]